MVRAGAMRHTIRIEQQSATLDGVGSQNSSAWTLFAERRAAVQRTPGKELVASAQVHARVPTVFRLRYLSGVTTDMRVVFAGRVYEVLSAVDQEARGEELIITADEWAGDAP